MFLRLCYRYRLPSLGDRNSGDTPRCCSYSYAGMSERSDVIADGGKAEGPLRPGQIESADAEIMREELRSVIASPDFARAPIMKRLLSFLVDETAEGRGDHLKAYSVAVDGLGRAPDYDARADSYPRVQVGRLRRMLASYYSTTTPTGGLRLTIPSGRYRVTLQPPGVVEESPLPAAVPLVRKLLERPLLFSGQVALLLLLVILGAFALLQVLPMRHAAPEGGRNRPVFEIGGVEMARSGELGNLIRATLINGLARSDLYDLRPRPKSGVAEANPAPTGYRLGADLSGGEHPRLFLRLLRHSPDRLIWSGSISLTNDWRTDSSALDRTLAPVIASIGRANGLVATHELQENEGRQAVGYSCLLLYHRYRKERTLGELDHVRTCVDRSLTINPRDAQLQAAAAQLTIEKLVSATGEPRDRPALLLTASRHAQIAMSIDPYDPWSNAAGARVAVLRKACGQAISFGARAVELQPYDPALLSDIGLYMLDCGDARAEPLIRRAIALHDEADGRYYTPLLLLAIGRDDPVMAREALTRMSPPELGQHGRFFLISAAGFAMIGDDARARAAWSQLVARSPALARDPQGFFERLGFAAELRAKAIRHLQRAKLIPST